MDELLSQEKTIPEEIRHAVLIRADRKTCYQTLTTNAGWNGWFTDDMSLDFKVGGKMIFSWKNWGADHISAGDYGTIVNITPDESFSFVWHPDHNGYATLVEFTFEDDPHGCVVRVNESGFAHTDEGLHSLVQCACGWGEALTLLKLFLEFGISTKQVGD